MQLHAEARSPLVTLRRATPDDSADGGRILFEAFRDIARQHGFPPDFESPHVGRELFRQFVSRSDIFGVVAEQDGRIAGSNFLWEGDAIAAIGPITVAPTAQNESIGRELMRSVLERASQQRFPGVRLVQAAYHSRSLALYAKLGFDPREPLAAMQGRLVPTRIPGRNVRKATSLDLVACDLLGARLLGFSRINEVCDAVRREEALVVEHAGRITGYTTGASFFGHSVGESNEDVQALIAAAREVRAPGLLVPTRNASLLRWGLERGLRIVQPMTLMTRGAYSETRGAYLPSVLY
jgi:ribosomal protein S18 acetylase RimI-like enzyme